MQIQTAIDIAMILRRYNVPNMLRDDSTVLVPLIDALLASPEQRTWTDIAASLGHSTAPGSVAKSKQRCVDLLHRAMALVDTELLDCSARLRVKIRAIRQYHTTQVLVAHKASSSSLDIMNHIRESTTRYHHFQLLMIAELSRRRELAFADEPEAYRESDRILKQLEATLAAEYKADRAEDAMRQVILHYQPDRDNLETLRATAADALAQCDTRVTRIVYYRITVWYAQLLKDYPLAIRAGTEAMAWLDAHPEFHTPSEYDNFAGNVLTSMLHVEQSADSDALWDALLKDADPRDPISHMLVQPYVSVLLMSKRFQHAADTTLRYFNECPKQAPIWRHFTWEIYASFVAELAPVGYIEDHDEWRQRRERALSVFRDEWQHVYRKHKTVDNALVIILDVISTIRQRQFLNAIDRIEQLQKYVTRYALESVAHRTARFMRMLSTLIASDFDPVRAQARADKILQRYPEADNLVCDDGEIMPYEVLWEIVMYHLHAASRNKI